MATTTTKQKITWHFVPCPGEAHSNPHIDNCGLCAPQWGKILVPTDCVDLNAWREKYCKLSDQERVEHDKTRKREKRRIQREEQKARIEREERMFGKRED